MRPPSTPPRCAPTWVAERVNNRCPHVEAPDARSLRVVGPRLRADRLTDLLDKLGLPGAGESQRLGEHGGLSRDDGPAVLVIRRPGEPVKGLGACLEAVDAEPRYRRLVLVEHRDLLRQREAPEKVIDPLPEREIRITERRILRGSRRGRWSEEEAGDQD